MYNIDLEATGKMEYLVKLVKDYETKIDKLSQLYERDKMHYMFSASGTTPAPEMPDISPYAITTLQRVHGFLEVSNKQNNPKQQTDD